MMWDWGMNTGLWGGWFGMLLMGFFALLVLLGFVLVVVWIVRSMGGEQGTGSGQGPQPDHDPAVATARERFARGEISQEELDAILRALRR
jgi:uncharacterized membrane protein